VYIHSKSRPAISVKTVGDVVRIYQPPNAHVRNFAKQRNGDGSREKDILSVDPDD
jgi:hypothetical protein